MHFVTKRRGMIGTYLTISFVMIIVGLSIGPSLGQRVFVIKPPTSDIDSSHPTVRIAVIKPVFTATAYSSFYSFYGLFAKLPPLTYVTNPTYLRLLNASVVDSWGWSGQVPGFLQSYLKQEMKPGAVTLSDIDVHQEKLFHNGVRTYDLLILGFTEYVTSEEYQQYKQFVSSGGTIIFLDATQFLAEVSYHQKSGTLSLVAGHGWVSNGTHAWKGPFSRWHDENTKWVGSNYGITTSGKWVAFNGAIAVGNSPLSRELELKYGDGTPLFTGYAHHEENVLTNSNATIIARWLVSGIDHRYSVAAYQLRYGSGTVFHTGVFASDIIGKDAQMQFFVLRMIAYALRISSRAG